MQSYLKNATRLSGSQIGEVLHVIAASLHDVGIVAARFLNSTATNQIVEGILETFIEQDVAEMNNTLEGDPKYRANGVSATDSKYVTSLILETLRVSESVEKFTILEQRSSVARDPVYKVHAAQSAFGTARVSLHVSRPATETHV